MERVKLLILICLISACNRKKPMSEPIYLKRDNSLYAVPFIYEFVCKLEGNSFKIIEYKNQFNAYISMGKIEQVNMDTFKLSLQTHYIKSLITGQIIKPNYSSKGIYYQISKDLNNTYKISKIEKDIRDLTFMEGPFHVLDTLNSIEKNLFNSK